MSAVKAARAAKAAADRRRVWYVMTSRVGREPRAKKERGTGDADCHGAAPLAMTGSGGGGQGAGRSTGKEESNAEV